MQFEIALVKRNTNNIGKLYDNMVNSTYYAMEDEINANREKSKDSFTDDELIHLLNETKI